MAIKTYTAASNIHGTGLFAAEDALPGRRIIDFEGHDSTTWSTHLIILDDRYLEVTNDAKYANHSDTPNTEMVGMTLVAIDYIPTDTEITFDYGWGEETE